MRILLATTNAGKVREIQRALSGAPVTLVTIDQALGAGGRALGSRHSALVEPEETGQTFAENAELKARYYAEHFVLPTVAEDSGLVIDALGGRPGVTSARYPGETYAEKFQNLYRELAPHRRPWTARFVCALAFVQQAPPSAQSPMPSALHVSFVASGVVEGEIAPEPRGSHGFGYDPIFFYPPVGMTTGEMSDELKLTISHRGNAFRQFAAWCRAGR